MLDTATATPLTCVDCGVSAADAPVIANPIWGIGECDIEVPGVKGMCGARFALANAEEELRWAEADVQTARRKESAAAQARRNAEAALADARAQLDLAQARMDDAQAAAECHRAN